MELVIQQLVNVLVLKDTSEKLVNVLKCIHRYIIYIKKCIICISVKSCQGQPECNDKGICNTQKGLCECDNEYYGDSCECKLILLVQDVI